MKRKNQNNIRTLRQAGYLKVQPKYFSAAFSASNIIARMRGGDLKINRESSVRVKGRSADILDFILLLLRNYSFWLRTSASLWPHRSTPIWQLHRWFSPASWRLCFSRGATRRHVRLLCNKSACPLFLHVRVFLDVFTLPRGHIDV